MNDENCIVYVVDDDPSVRTLLKKLMQSIGLPVEVYASSREFLDHPHPAVPSCLILDVRMPGQSGFELQEQLAASSEAVPIVFITGFGNVPQSVRAMKAGAVDFLEKPFENQEMLDAVNRGLERSRRFLERRREESKIEELVKTLSPREYDVFVRIVAGLANKEAAHELGLSEKTVKIHRARVMRKMNAGSFAELVRMAERLRISVKQPQP
ncbi:MAG: DNA-binding response regulator [Candidatus Latescibacterota bacterium]|jgi:FixJ family two-component response regulator|nr:MAG: DNA-binding response regulator [Candidatus Latescibacterota bacterium]